MATADPLARPDIGASAFGHFLSQILSDRERFFAEVTEGIGLRRKLAYSFGTLVALLALYGAAAGAYAGPLQAVSASLKLPVLFLGTLAICFPGFFVIQVLVGSRLQLMQMLTLVVSALALSAVLLAAIVPVSVFFLITGANYHFLSLLHAVIVLLAGLVGMTALHVVYSLQRLAHADDGGRATPRRNEANGMLDLTRPDSGLARTR